MIITMVGVFPSMNVQPQQFQTSACPLCGAVSELIGQTYSHGSPTVLFSCDSCSLFWRETQ